MIRAIIVDDELKSISTIQKIIEDFCSGVVIVGTAENIIDAALLIKQCQPQLVFLDVEMPYGNGFDLLNRLVQINFEIIFITAYNQYAINAFKYASVDYLLKPVNITHLQDAIVRAEKRIVEKQNSANYLLLIQNLKTDQSNEKCLMLADANGQQFFKIKDITYCIADGSYTFIYAINGLRFHASKNLKEFEDLLPKELFFRIHHGHIVNVSYVKKIQSGRTGNVEMKDGKCLEVAARRKKEFIDFLQLNTLVN